MPAITPREFAPRAETAGLVSETLGGLGERARTALWVIAGATLLWAFVAVFAGFAR